MSRTTRSRPRVPARRIVVLGTGTAVGKTWVTRALAEALRRHGAPVVAVKPIETGVAASVGPGTSDPRATIRSRDSLIGERSDAEVLASVSSVRPGAPPYTFIDPVSPHLAARRAQRAIDLNAVVAYVGRAETEVASHVASFCIIETAGGCLSPLGLGVSNVDFAFALEPAIWVLVAPDALGVLHDVSATLGVLAARHRLPDHLVLCAARDPDASTGTNGPELEALGIVTPSATLGRGDALSIDALACDWVARGPSRAHEHGR